MILSMAGADKSNCLTPGASDFSDRASTCKNHKGLEPWASDILKFGICILKMKVPYPNIIPLRTFFLENSLQSRCTSLNYTP